MTRDIDDWCQIFAIRGGFLAEVLIGKRAVQARGETREQAIERLHEALGHGKEEAA